MANNFKSNYDKKNSSKDTNHKKSYVNKKNNSKNLENTTRIRVDDVRLNDADSLDVSFLDKRVNKKVSNNTKAKEKILNDNNNTVKILGFFKYLFFIASFICIAVLCFLIFKKLNLSKFISSDKNTNNSDNVEIINKDNLDSINKLDDNNLFVGDFYFNDLDFNNDEYKLDYHFVNYSSKDESVSDVLSDLNKHIYEFNPSNVVLHLGLLDLIDGRSVDDILSDYRMIISGIKDNRPYATIYIDMLFPLDFDSDDFDSRYVGDDVTNSVIMELNKKLKELAKKENINVIDLYDDLDDSTFYSKDGVSLNPSGNQFLIDEYKRVVKCKHEK